MPATRTLGRASLVVLVALVPFFCLALTGGVAPGEAHAQAPPRETWAEFAGKRQLHLSRLARPVLECVRRHDTDHPAFHGCIDWHSAVHGHYALHALFRLTGNRTYLAAANKALTRGALRSELRAVRAGEVAEELPYGYAWFLALAVERERATGRKDLRPLAAEIVRQLSPWIRSLSHPAVSDHLSHSDYSNLAWPLINMLAWFEFRGDARSLETWRTFIRRHVSPRVLSGRCLSRDLAERNGFLPPCLLQVMAAARATTRGPQAARARLRSALRNRYRDWRPLDPGEIYGHSAGLNFSRSWGLWAAFASTGDLRYRAAFQAHMTALLSQPRYWNENYSLYSHWVAQFGIYALALTFESP